MILLKNTKDFDAWQKDNLTSHDEPTEFPCYAYSTVSSWQYEIEEANYLYRRDVEKMLDDMNA